MLGRKRIEEILKDAYEMREKQKTDVMLQKMYGRYFDRLIEQFERMLADMDTAEALFPLEKQEMGVL